MIVPPNVMRRFEADVDRVFEALPKPNPDGAPPSQSALRESFRDAVDALSRMRLIAYAHHSTELLHRVQVLSDEASTMFERAATLGSQHGLVVPG